MRLLSTNSRSSSSKIDDNGQRENYLNVDRILKPAQSGRFSITRPRIPLVSFSIASIKVFADLSEGKRG